VDIRTKFVFALVAVALASMLAFGVSIYGSVERELRERTLERLEALAQFKVDALHGILDGWRDRVNLVASRTQLRRSLARYNRTESSEAIASIDRILQDALDASPLFVQLWVHAADGTPLAGVSTAAAAVVSPDVDPHEPDPETEYLGVRFAPGAPPTVSFSAPLELEGVVEGFLHVVLATDELAALSSNFGGLGFTGETMIVARDGSGAPRVLHPVRFADGGPIEDEFGVDDVVEDSIHPAGRRGGAGLSIAADEAALRSLDSEDSSTAGGLSDYRGEEVWAATRFIPDTGWGVVVKIDADEQVRPIRDFRMDIVRLAVTLSAFAILVGTFLGFRFSKPILTLAEAAGRIEEGDYSARVKMTREDEVGLLARTFDDMAGALEEQVSLLDQFRRFFSVSVDMMCIASMDGYFQKVNPAFTRELGWSEEELRRRPFLTLVHPDDIEKTEQEIESLTTGRPTISFENRYLCADGTYKRLHWNSYPEGDTGRIYAIARVQDPKPPVDV
jgi:PAS domain S-box-containing protein